MSHVDRSRPRALLAAAMVTSVFVGAWVASIRLAGTSPIVWIDTFNDELEVQRCLVDDSCTLTGMSTSVPGQAHAVAWLELRTLLAWFGFGLDGAHRAMVLSHALAAALVFQVAAALGGPVAGTMAAWLALDRIDEFARTTALYNTSPLLFFGAVFTLACIAVIARPGALTVILAALVAAAMTNIHLACAMTGVSVVCAAIAAPRRKLALAACGGVIFLIATFALAPPTWLHNFNSLAREGTTRGHLVTLSEQRNPMMGWALFAVVAWIASLTIRTPAAATYRRQTLGVLAVMLPSLVVFLIAPRYGFNPEAKYIFHLKTACAIAVALPIGIIAGRVLPLRVQQVLPFLLALALIVPGGFAARARVTADDERVPTVADVAAVADLLRGEDGWSTDEILRNLKTPFGVSLLSGVQTIARRPAPPAAARGVRGSSALLLVLEPSELPQPLPPNWRVVRQASQSLAVLVRMRSRIDWRELIVCVQPAGGSRQCEHRHWEPSHDLYSAQLPPGGAGWQGTLQLTLALQGDAADFVSEIFMPRMPFVCGGRISEIPSGVLDADQRHARYTVAPAAPAARPTVTLLWNIGAPECDGLAYDGIVPFFVEGDTTTVRAVTAILRKREGHL